MTDLCNVNTTGIFRSTAESSVISMFVSSVSSFPFFRFLPPAKRCTRNEVVTFLNFSEQTLTDTNIRRITGREGKGLPYPKFCRTIYAIILAAYHTAYRPCTLGRCFLSYLEMSNYVIRETHDFSTFKTGRRLRNKDMDRK